MICSMTGFAALTSEIEGASLQIELRSVNSRYLDTTFRVCEELRFTEPSLRELISSNVARGKIECRMNLQTKQNIETAPELNQTLLDQLKHLQESVLAHTKNAKPLSVNEILRWPGILAESIQAPEALLSAVQDLAKAAIEDFKASRAREGSKLVEMLRSRINLMRDRIAAAEPLIPSAIADYRERINQRLREAVATLDEDRIRQEVTLFAQRADVAEEITRLQTHLDEIERILTKGGAVGKRLDFLMQELNREANTLGSKAVMPQLTDISVDLKVYIEQMREQIQNLE